MNRKRIEIFLEFLIFGVLMGVVEDLIAVKFATDHLIDARTILIAFLVSIPFAAIGELIVDKTHLIPKTGNKYWRHIEMFLEFLIFGIIMGVVEDLIAVTLITGEPITMEIMGLVTLVSIPFAIIGELIVDYQDLIDCKLTNKC
ncbi:MAG: hypothetical protein AABY16_00795 [Nanoarchaeota archaeon]